MVYNFATTGRVTRPHIVTLRADAQGRTMFGAARTSCGVVLLMVLPTPTVTTCLVVVGVRITITVRKLFRCAVSLKLHHVLIKLAQVVKCVTAILA